MCITICNLTVRLTFSSGPHKDVNNLIRFHIVVRIIPSGWLCCTKVIKVPVIYCI